MGYLPHCRRRPLWLIVLKVEQLESHDMQAEQQLKTPPKEADDREVTMEKHVNAVGTCSQIEVNPTNLGRPFSPWLKEQPPAFSKS